ncbi:PEPxxWA-CTERM sorting domain-containing protein [Sphingobium boeckii]|uniref:Ice-binding protein C-terminal domain-containing protein n=1 Tax=Sphingobium boeckii TaxID=1082345 RepID=A0A7W9AIB6_9SPHN|nr:PEPxxWA-CTERM sorting domain-containing protein [Sphingobium boeckii]MBB5686021.1 hypothetical protein [Sphingobium boeckii]
MKRYLLAGAALLSMTSAANAANLISAEVRGLNASQQASGTVWNTTVDGFYTLFLGQPAFNGLNPQDQAINNPSELGANDFVVLGDGWPVGTNTNSDPFYQLTLKFEGGASIAGVYDATAKTLVSGTSALIDNAQYTLTGFGWERTANVNNVSANSAVPGGSTSDYAGQFSFDVAAVPEPATWAMMITGFGFVGGSMRRRAVKTTVSYAV